MYPPGYGPYLRKLLAPLDYNGAVLHSDNGIPDWQNTFFESVLDYKNGYYWRVNPDLKRYQPNARTQYRQIFRAKELFIGRRFSPKLQSLHEIVCGWFNTLFMEFQSELKKLQDLKVRVWKQLVQLLCLFLEQFKSDECVSPAVVYERLLVLGCYHQIWGKPHRLTSSGRVVPIDFRELPEPEPP